jgi:hypothetical protein
VDFLRIKVKTTKDKSIEISPQFVVSQSKDLMIRGNDFYAIWDEENNSWSTNEDTAIRLIDKELKKSSLDHEKLMPDTPIHVKYMWAADSGSIDAFHKFCQKQMRDNYVPLDMSLIFLDTKTERTDYSTKRLTYSLKESSIDAYDELISTLYDDTERLKIEWAIGAILSGDSKWIQKFIVFYGGPGTGKSTIINIIQELFKGYYSIFDAKSLGSSNDSFALEAFKSNPLVAIQHDGDLSRIEDNTRLNSIVSHEEITINEKFKAKYTNRLQCMLIMGTNKPVKITDAKSGITRRLIDIFPSGRKIPTSRYNELVSQIRFELGGIAYHCLDIYNQNKSLYDDYVPINMIGATNDFYMFMEEKYEYLKESEHVTLSWLWDEYKKFCEDAKVSYPLLKRNMKIEAMTYFKEYEERGRDSDGKCLYNVYRGFKTERFTNGISQKNNEEVSSWLDMTEQESILDEVLKDCKAQYANDDGIPTKKWNKCETALKDIDTSMLHYVQVPLNHIVIDFDIPNVSGEKDFEINLKEALKWKPTYAEVSKSGKGIHLHYLYDGDVNLLSRVYSPSIEIKVFTGNSSLRRKLSKCNALPIATLAQGCLPEKKGGTGNMINFEGLKNEKMLRNMIKKNLAKQYHSSTASSVDFIYKLLEDAYSKGIVYDVRDMRPAITSFACNSTHQSEKCLELVSRMKWCSENVEETAGENSEAPVVFFDVEVFPNLFVVVWKRENEKPHTLINPSPDEIENLCKFRLIGFNNRKYDNHILYARMHGYSNEELYALSQKIIQNSPNSMFGEAYNLSYTDIYDFSSKKQSLKKFEIELGIHHQELGLKWDEPVPENLWQTVADYCINDVEATEAVFKAREADFLAREILAEIAGGTVNDTTNSLTTKLIFGKNRHPQDEFHYRNLSEPVTELDNQTRKFLEEECGLPIPFDENSLLPYFKGYKYENGVSTYRGFEVGEGGFVYSEPGAYSDVALLDVASEHPHSITSECLFGIRYTKAFKDLMDTRILVKHKDFEAAKKMFDGKLARFLDDESKSKMLAQALKIAINSVYGLTAARFENPFRDPRNIDNIVAKRGALFMIDLMYAVQEKGFKVAHIKTDSIKIPNATPEIIKFVMDFGKKYGYTFEHEATYERICLVNDAVYIAKYDDGEHEFKLPTGEKLMTSWTATGTQFQVPFVFKTLFSKSPVNFRDTCETKNVKTAMYLDMNENLPEGEHNYKFVGRTGLYCPIKEGCGGGRLVRENGDKYDAVVGTKGYKWLEAETVKNLNMEDCIDISYYSKLVDDAVETISQYVISVDSFANGEDKELWEVPF